MSATANPVTLSPVADTHHVVRERRFSPRTPLDLILDMLASSGATGTLHIDFNQGGIGTARFEERQRINPE